MTYEVLCLALEKACRETKQDRSGSRAKVLVQKGPSATPSWRRPPVALLHSSLLLEVPLARGLFSGSVVGSSGPEQSSPAPAVLVCTRSSPGEDRVIRGLPEHPGSAMKGNRLIRENLLGAWPQGRVALGTGVRAGGEDQEFRAEVRWGLGVIPASQSSWECGLHSAEIKGGERCALPSPC